MAIDDDQLVDKLSEGTGRSAIELIDAGKINFVINTPRGSGSRADGYYIRRQATLARIGSVTTVEAALALASGLHERANSELKVRSLQEYHAAARGS